MRPGAGWAGGGVWPPCRRIPGVGAALTGPAYNEKLLIYHSDKTSRSFVTTSCPRQGHGMRWELICRVVLQRWRPASQNFDFPRWDGQGHWTVDTDRTIVQIFYSRRSHVDHRSSKQETGHYLFLPSSTYQYIHNGPLSHSASSRKIKWPKIFLFLVAFAVFLTPKLLLLVCFLYSFWKLLYYYYYSTLDFIIIWTQSAEGDNVMVVMMCKKMKSLSGFI